jgi:uncharacterized protein YfaS (alpha-2-macroglobulin family)
MSRLSLIAVAVCVAGGAVLLTSQALHRHLAAPAVGVLAGSAVAPAVPATAPAPTAPAPLAPVPLAAAPLAAAPAPAEQVSAVAAPAAPAFAFSHLNVSTTGDAPELCLRFTARLNPHAEARYQDWVTVEPQAAVAMHVQDHALCVGGLAYGTEYKLTLHAGLPAADGARLAADEVVPASLGDRERLVDIGGDGFILPRAVAHGLTIQTVNVRQLRIHVLRVSDRLVPAETRSRQRDTVSLAAKGLWGYALRNLLLDTASIVWTGTMDVPEDHNRTVQTAFPLTQVIKPGMTGAFLVVAEDAAHAAPDKDWKAPGNDEPYEYGDDFYRNKATHWVIATDIALTSYTGTDGMLVGARSLGSALPLAGVRLSLLSTGQDVLGEAVTDAAGVARFPAGLLRGRTANAATGLVAHGPDGDWTLMQLDRPGFDFSDRGVTGRPSPAPLQAFLYTERGIYRPGHSVELMALLRDRVGDAVAAPLTLVLRRPNGLEAKRWQLAPQPAAGFHQSIPLSATAPRGTWSVEALADPEGAPVGRVSFEVQDYVPQQLKVKLAPIAGPVAPDANITVGLDGDFLYGAPAAGLHGQADLRVTRDADPVPSAKGWQFGLVDETVEDKTKTVELPPADAKGHTQAEAAPDLPADVHSPLKLVITAGLFEPSGRQVSDAAEVKLRTKPILIGLRSHVADGGFEQPVGLEIAVFDADGHRVARPGLIWHVVREERFFDWFQDNGWHWHYHTEDRGVEDGRIDVGTATARLTRQDGWGSFRLIVEDPASGATSSIRYENGWVETAGDVEQPDKVSVSVDHAAIAEGATARVHIAAPFAGRATFLVANDKIIESRELEVPKGGLDVPVTAGPDWGAGAYALVTLYRPLSDGSAHEPVRAVGTVWIGMDAAPRTLGVAIGTPDRVLPQRDLRVPLQIGNVPAGTQAYVTLAAVDEGILQLTRYATPDPAGFLFGKRALGVSMRDDYAKLLDGSADPGQIQGGDEGVGGPGLPVVSTRTVAIFNGPISVDADGNASVTLHIPDFEGQLRLMAVAYTTHAVGSAARTLIVRDPVVADIAMPRFLADGDSASLAVSLTNTDGAAGAYHLRVSVGGAAGLQGPGDFSDTLAAAGRARHAVEVLGKASGVATVDADLTGPDAVHVHRSWSLSVRPAHAPLTVQQTAWQKPGESFRIDPALADPFVAGTAKISLGYSRVGGIDVPGLLQSLDEYPFGCTEQLSSTAFPLIYFSDPALHAAMPDAARVHARVQAAIDTILDRQGDDGEFGLWRINDGEASLWLNVYALDFLMHAKDAGYDVPDSAIQRASLWLRAAADGDARRSYDGVYAQGPEMTQPYAAYVLARLGRIDLAGLRRVHDTVSEAGVRLTRDASHPFWYYQRNVPWQPLALGQMAGAFALTGDRGRARDSFRKAIDNLGHDDWPRWWFDWSYSTPARDWAGLVAIAAETNQDDALQTLLNTRLPERLSLDGLNTQEKASLLSAAHALAKSTERMQLLVNGEASASGGTPSFTPDVAAVQAGFSVANQGGQDIWRALTVSGNPKEAGPALANGYSIAKHYYTLSGAPVDPAKLRQSDRMVVVIDGDVTDRIDTHRTVVVDMLPAGWEIESPVHDENEFGFIGPLSQTRLREARDDRFVAAMDFGENLRRGFRRFEETNDDKPHLDDWEFRVAYVARAITPGHFTLPEAVVQDMYRPAVMARTEAGVTEVAPR